MSGTAVKVGVAAESLLGSAEKREATSESSGEEAEGEEANWALEENGPRRRPVATELRDVVDDALLLLFRRLDLSSLYGVERTCRRFRRLAKSPSLYNSIHHIRVTFAWQVIWLEKNKGAETKLKSKEQLEGLAKQLASRGARPAVLELDCTVRVTSMGFRGLRLLQPRTLFVHCERMKAQLVQDILRHRSLQCLVIDLGRRASSDAATILSRLRPTSHPDLRALILFGKCWVKPLLNGEAPDFRAWADSQLVCFRTDEKHRSFLKGPKDTPPHPDLLRLSRRIRWAH